VALLPRHFVGLTARIFDFRGKRRGIERQRKAHKMPSCWPWAFAWSAKMADDNPLTVLHPFAAAFARQHFCTKSKRLGGACVFGNAAMGRFLD
jgi:hypothetical protein